jgi:hypothetical protein
MGDRQRAWSGTRRRTAVAVVAIAVTATAAAFVLPDRLGSGDGVQSTPPSPAPRKGLRAAYAEKAGCKVSAKLVPSCGAWWGVAPGAFTSTPPTRALRDFERKIGRTVDIYHGYHRGTEIFPTREEMAIARQPGKPRILLLNWKPDWGRSWASVAAGSMDGHIDRLAAHIKANFREKFFLVIHHEPEEEVRPPAGSGYTAADFRKMFRHVVLRFRAKGVGNALFTPVFMGFEHWGVKPWFDQLYPGGDVVDWLGVDPYASAETRDFSHLVNLSTTKGRGFPGFYNWAGQVAPRKPIMIAEWGVFSSGPHKPTFYKSVAAQLKQHPRVKALVYFETPDGPFSTFRIDTRIDTDPAALAAFKAVSHDPQVNPSDDHSP